MAGKDKRANGSATDDAEFERLLDEMDELGRQADALRAKVNHLIDEMRENDVPPDDEADEEVDGVAVKGHDEAGNAAGEGDVAVDADSATNGAMADEEAVETENEADGVASGEDYEQADPRPDAT